MKKYLTTFATVFFGSLIVGHLMILVFLFGMWEFEKLSSLYDSDGFWAMVRILFIFSLTVSLFGKFKIVKA